MTLTTFTKFSVLPARCPYAQGMRCPVRGVELLHVAMEAAASMLGDPGLGFIIHSTENPN